MIKHEAKIKAISWVENGNKRYDIWQGKEINDKDCIDIDDILTYTTDIPGYSSNYKENLIDKIIEIHSMNKGLTHLEVWEKGRLINIFRITNLPSKGEFKSWDEVILFINRN